MDDETSRMRGLNDQAERDPRVAMPEEYEPWKPDIDSIKDLMYERQTAAQTEKADLELKYETETIHQRRLETH